MICYKNKVTLKKPIYFFKTIPSKELEDCMIVWIVWIVWILSSKGRLLERGMPIHVIILLSLQDRQTVHCVQYRQ